MKTTTVLYVLAFACFLLGGLSVSMPSINWLDLGLAFAIAPNFIK